MLQFLLSADEITKLKQEINVNNNNRDGTVSLAMKSHSQTRRIIRLGQSRPCIFFECLYCRREGSSFFFLLVVLVWSQPTRLPPMLHLYLTSLAHSLLVARGTFHSLACQQLRGRKRKNDDCPTYEKNRVTTRIAKRIISSWLPWHPFEIQGCHVF